MPDDLDQLIDELYRSESARFIAVLTRAFGFERHQLIEDVVHTALMEAVHAWRAQGAPENPSAWVYRVAHNRLLDLLRREKKYKELMASWEGASEACESAISAWFEAERLPDAQLRMLFVCCHPDLDRKSQIILALKTLCGFTLDELSRALAQSKSAIKKRWQRARQHLQDAEVSLELPSDSVLHERGAAVCQLLYVMFNEGYSPSQGEEFLRRDICKEVLRLTRILCESTYVTDDARALMALCCFHFSRFDSRGDLVVAMLNEQDRGTWDQALISEGLRCLSLVQDQAHKSIYIGEAKIAAEHCRATHYDATNWRRIAELYGRLYQLHPSPFYMLNQAVALIELNELDMAQQQLQHIAGQDVFRYNAYVECAFAYLSEKQGKQQRAQQYYIDALAKPLATHEERYVQRRLASI